MARIAMGTELVGPQRWPSGGRGLQALSRAQTSNKELQDQAIHSLNREDDKVKDGKFNSPRPGSWEAAELALDLLSCRPVE